MTARMTLRLEVDADVLSGCDEELASRRAVAEIAGLLTGLGVDVPVSVAVTATSDLDAVAVLCRERETVATLSKRRRRKPALPGLVPDLVTSPPAEAAELLGLVARQLAAQDLPRLLGEDVVRDLPVPAGVARHLLDLWTRIPNAVAAAEFGEEFGPDELAEAIFAASRPAEVRLRIAPDYLRAITGPAHEEAFAFVRPRLSRALGLPPPPLHFEATSEISGQLIQPVVNDVPTMPIRGLAPDALMVAERADRLREAGFTAEPAPAGEFAYVPAHELPRLTGTYTCWNPAEAIAAWWEEFAPVIAWRTFDARTVEQLMDAMWPRLPVLVRVAGQFPARRLAGRLRSRYRSDSSLHQLPLVLERELESLLLGPSSPVTGEIRD
ncbi:hypothetical protein [Amycolatopsis sp. MEPSY49]|uniref:hypothetical protein n=1 Tax=Amycolatopsis sp. MEPSY49 TaxID=3151600 RepID=UPI003EF8B1E5